MTSGRKTACGELIGEYERRARHYFDLSVVEISPGRLGSGTPEQVRRAEAQTLLRRLPPDRKVFALTRTGEGLTSMELVSQLEHMAVSGLAGAVFIIGGAYGLAQAVLDVARHRLSLSPMTLPHELARLLLTEQLYRAGTILRGEPYHKGKGPVRRA